MQRCCFWIVFLLLLIFHQDWWFWNNGSLVFGFLPVGLGYHALYSLAAAALWAWAIFGVFTEMFSDPPEETPSSSTQTTD